MRKEFLENVCKDLYLFKDVLRRLDGFGYLNIVFIFFRRILFEDIVKRIIRIKS